jgi:Ala-tRNA(Pro) deacylase
MQGMDRMQEYLEQQHVPFELEHHVPTYTAQEVAQVEHVPGKQVAKIVMVMADGDLVLLVLPATARLDFNKVYAALDAEEVRLAREEEFAKVFPDCEVGAMPPFGNLYGVPVYVDSTLAEDEHIIIPAGTHTDSMRIAYADFARLVNPRVISLAIGA